MTTWTKVTLTAGRRAIGWLAISIAASLTLVVVELGISVCLQVFLKMIGLLKPEAAVTGFFGGEFWTPSKLAAGLCLLALVRSITLFLVGQSGNISMETITARLRRLAIWETLLAGNKASIPAAAVNARVGDLANKAAQFCYSGSSLIASGVQATAFAIVMLVTAKGETFIAMFGLGLLGLFVIRLNRITRRVTSTGPRELRVMTDGIERVARNLTLVRVLRTETIEHRRLTTAIDTYARHMIHAAYLGNFAGALTPFCGILLIIVIVVSSQGVLHTPGLTLLSFSYLFMRFVQTLSMAVQHYSTCNTMWPSFEDSLEYVGRFQARDIESAMLAGPPATGRAVERAFSTGGAPPAIEIEDVTFAYPGSGSPVLQNISTRVEPGSQLAIVGPSGCGKSTLLGLMLGLFEPTEGTIRLAGQNPTSYFGTPGMRVGYVGAEAFLVAGTIRENLRYGLSVNADDNDLWDSLSAAQLRGTVESLPGQLEYMIHEDGSGLSAGQKQRLCLARALLGKPQLLVLDEVSANLDTDTEQAIAESLRHLRGPCTTILVSHRSGILAYADRVIDLEASNSA
jgi:ABC-type multidrug transport system fused ATPase/permease subunit